MPAWIVPIAAILVLQTATAYLSRTIPIVSPALTEELDWDRSWVGYLASANTFGALLTLTLGSGLIRGMGSLRALQVSLLVGAVSLALFAAPWVALALVASLLTGLSTGTSHPAGSEVLQRFTPPARRNLMFSIKQAGVPLGGALAGLTIAPFVDAAGWRAALVVTASVVVAATLLTWRLRPRIDALRSASPPIAIGGWRSVRRLVGPLQLLARGPGLLRMALVGALLGIGQSVWFTFAVTYLVVGLGWSLTAAGSIFAVMQASSVVGRILMGWIADRVASATATMALAGIVSAGSTTMLGLSQPGWPGWTIVLLAILAGLSVSSWNGVQIAEVARRSPPDLVVETAAGAGIVIFISNVAGPAVFALLVALTGRYDYGFFTAALASLTSLALLWGMDRPERSGRQPGV